MRLSSVLSVAFLVTVITGCAAPIPTDPALPVATGVATIVVPRGATGSQIGTLLDGAGVVSRDDFVSIAGRDPRALAVQPGTYSIERGLTATQALEALLNPDSRVDLRVRVNGGQRAAEVAEQLADLTGWSLDETLTAFRVDPETHVSSLDGLLGTATYEVLPDDTAASIAKLMLVSGKAAVEKATELAVPPRTTRELLTVASILHAEVAPRDWKKASRVIWNRLAAGQPLQLDSTVAYAAGVRQIELSAEQMSTPSRYNTYLYPGLPPGPIGQVTVESVVAAAQPEEGTWLYWVTVNPDTGETRFSSSYDQFLKDKSQYKKWLAAQPR